jgi:hypothetical protein
MRAAVVAVLVNREESAALVAQVEAVAQEQVRLLILLVQMEQQILAVVAVLLGALIT